MPDDLNGLDRVQPQGAPVANPDGQVVAPGAIGHIDVLSNDVAMIGQLDPASVTIFEPPTFGFIEGIDPETGAITYRHDGGPSLEDSFLYIVFDDKGEVSEVTPVLITISTPEAVEGPQPGRQAALTLAGPNPFHAATTFLLRPTQSGQVTVAVYDMAGRRVCTLVDERMEAGEVRQVPWDGRDSKQRPLAAGVYGVQMRSAGGENRLSVLHLK